MSSFATNTVCAHNTLCTRELMEETVNVMNHALGQPGKRSGIPKRKSLAEKILNGKTLRVQVLSANDLDEKAAVALKFDEERVKLVKADNALSADGTMKVSEEHLREVSNDPDTFVEDPMKLELIWLKDRMTETGA